MGEQEQARESRLRRLAKLRGYVLRKSRVRDPRSIDYGRWYLIEPTRNYLVANCENLDQVEARLTR